MLHILLYIHIVFISLSLVITSLMCGMAVFGKDISKTILHSVLAITTIGLTAGTLLLLSLPLSPQCLMLAGYLGVFVAAYRFLTIRQRSQSAAASTK